MTEEERLDAFGKAYEDETKREKAEERIREIVREEFDKRIGPWRDYESRINIRPPKPKSDLERAAEIADAAFNKDFGPPLMVEWTREYDEAYQRGYKSAARSIGYDIRQLRPSPDWRKIADLLARAVREWQIGATPGPTRAYHDPNCAACKDALAQYDFAVKEADK